MNNVMPSYAPINREPDIVNMLFGSHLYGLSTPDSDYDFKGIYMPKLGELLLGNYPATHKHTTGIAHEKNQAGDVDLEVISLPKFIKHACDGETFAIDMLHCELPISTSPIWEELVSLRTLFYSRNMKAYIGYVKKQAAKYGLKGTRLACIRKAMEKLSTLPMDATIGYARDCLYYGDYAKWVNMPSRHVDMADQEFYEVNQKKYQSTNTVGYVLTQLEKMWEGYGHRAKQAEKNEGVDWKALSHALRAGFQARDIFLKGDFKYPLDETDYLLAVKRGELDYKTDVAPKLETLVELVEGLADNSTFPAKVDRQYWGAWLLEKYSEHFGIDIKTKPFDNFTI